MCVFCPNDWYQNLTFCYKLFRNLSTWYEAEAICNTYNASLLKIDNILEYNYTYAYYYKSLPPNANLWVCHILRKHFMLKLINC